MKKRIILLIFLIVLLAVPFASASIFDWIAEITGRATAEEVAVKTESAIIKEQVKCTFLNSNTEQKCYSSDGNFGCSAIDTCLVGVSGEKGKTIAWKSTCGSEAYTTIDGSDEYVEFKCEQVAVQAQTTETPATTQIPVPIEIIKEQVKCVFSNSNSEQKCYTDDGRFGCSGMGSCIAEMSGEKGTMLTWKSSCGGYANTLIDGNNDYAEFKCEQITTATPVPTTSTAEITETIKEQVKCVFVNSVSTQECYGGGGACKGTGTCIADVSGSQGTKLTWKSSCGGYAYTVIDGNNEHAEFQCEKPAETTFVKEQVKCVFSNSNSEQKCYTDDGRFGCSGTGTCIADVYAEQGKKLVWKSSCGGYAYTVVDGNNDYAEFKCEQIATPTPVPAEIMKEQVKCVFANSNSEQKCGANTYYNDKSAECSGIGTCVADVIGQKGTMLTWKSSCGGYAYTVIDGNNEYAEFQCEKPAETTFVKEQVKCVFSNSNSEQKCYTDDGRFGCSGMGTCIADVYAEQGKKIVWKSTCGGYGYSVIDGNNEDIGFDCIPSSNVTSEQISGKGFSHAYWQCYDGTEEKSIEGVELTACKSSEIWQEYAKKFCENSCNKEGTKCGVNSFSVSGECYIDVAKEGVFISSFMEEKKTEEIKKAEKLEKAEEKIKPMLICKDSCPLDEKCYPFGYRKEGKYCYDEGAFKEQLKDNAVCENNFECQTNVCVDGKCISSGLIQKIMGWFKKLFWAG